jgi:preprotein translocase subunit SecG
LVQALLIVVELVVAVSLIIVVLLQRSEGGGLGMGGGGGSGFGGLFSPRGAADALTRTTAILGGLFFLTCLGLNLLALHGRNEKSFLESPAPASAPVTVDKPLLPTGPKPAPSVPTPH